MTREFVRNFSIELALLVLLPLMVIVAGAVTATIAYRGGFTPLPEHSGHVVVNPH